MTLIIGLVGKDQSILVSDRRLTHLTGPVSTVMDDDSNKAVVFVCRDARLAVAFTGLAYVGPPGSRPGPEQPGPGVFSTKWWLVDALDRSARPDALIGPTIERFRDNATRDFARIPRADRVNKGLTVVFAGYTLEAVPRALCLLVSNVTGPAPSDVSDEFSLRGGLHEAVLPEWEPLCFSAGRTIAVTSEQGRKLLGLLEGNAPTVTLIGNALQVVRQAATSPEGRGLIGTTCTSIVLPRNPTEQPSYQYHYARPTNSIGGPSFVVALAPGDVTIFMDPQVTVKDYPGGPSILVPLRVGRDKPCSCGSGEKYKKCCGRVA